MKAEEISNEFCKDMILDPLQDLWLETKIKEYARIQIENHIESIRENPIYTDGSIDLESTLNNTPINLD